MAEGWPRDPDTWRADREIILRHIIEPDDENAFYAAQFGNGSDLIDSNYVEIGTLNAYPSVISINNNFGASAGDTLVFGGFRADRDVVLSMCSRPVDWLFSYNRELYPEYAWIDPFKPSGIELELYVQPDCRGEYLQYPVWDEEAWPEPLAVSVGPFGQAGFGQEWRGFDLTRLADNFTSFAVDTENEPVLDQSNT